MKWILKKIEDMMKLLRPVRKSGFIILLLFVISNYSFSENIVAASAVNTDESIKIIIETAPFAMPEITVPTFPEQNFNILQYGAIGDGYTFNTIAFATAIQACTNAGGGLVIVPAGLWLTGPIVLASNVNLHLEEGAVILFSRNFDDYPLVPVTFEGVTQFRCQSPITAINVENIAITGQGIIDGSGDAWRPVKKFKMTSNQWRNLLNSGGVISRDGSVWWPTAAAMNGEALLANLERSHKPLSLENVAPARDFLRPVMVRLDNCRNVLLDGPTFQNSPSWNIHPLLCENVIIRNITVRNPWYSQNGDGLDIESCNNVMVYRNHFDVGDDAICLKSGKDEQGRQRARPSENIIITECTVYHGHGGFTIGSEMSGGVRNVFVSNCTFIGTDVGLRFKSLRGRGGVVEKIYVQDIRMLDIPNEAVLFDLFYENTDDDEMNNLKSVPLVNEKTPVFRDIHFSKVFCVNAATAIFLNGLPELPLQHIEFDSVFISSDRGVFCSNVQDLSFSRVTFITETEPVLSFSQSRQIEIKPLRTSSPGKVWMKINGENSSDIHLDGTALNATVPAIIFGDNAKPGAVILKNWDE